MNSTPTAQEVIDRVRAGGSLKGATLAKLDFGGAQLQRADFSGVTFSEVNLKGANLQQAVLAGSVLDRVMGYIPEGNLTKFLDKHIGNKVTG